jgi:molybdenum cofactor biosynthesis enzyme MoaA
LDYVEQIYFAGGEPLMMAEHYNILDELERRGRFDVRLIAVA